MRIDTIKRSQITPMPEYFGRYINQVADTTLREALDESIRQIDALDFDALDRIGTAVYAEGKWPIATIVTHITDFERILGYRTLVYARQAGIVPQGIEEDTLAVNSRSHDREIRAAFAELRIARLSTKAMFEGFDDQAFDVIGKIWKDEMTVLAMGFNMIGHQIHHLRVIEERYLPLLKG